VARAYNPQCNCVGNIPRQPVISAASGHDRWLPTKRPIGQFYLSQEGKLKKVRAAAGVCVNYFGVWKLVNRLIVTNRVVAGVT
jgi:hypothetical protein